jgi:hypothetical protein
VVAGALLIVNARAMPRAPPAAREGLGRLRGALRMTPMLRLQFLAEVGTVFAVATGAASAWRFATLDYAAAAAVGGVAGALLMAILAPGFDARFGRGGLLSFALLAAAAAPLALLGAPGPGAPGPSTLAVFAACALFAVALASLPQRSALLFDLSSSRARARLAADLQGLKLLLGAAAVPAYLLLEQAAPGLGPLAGAVFAACALALYAPALGALGAPRRDRPQAPG